jgi:hypothetical protein
LKTNVYVDGFNLYYGALKDSRYKWLNVLSLVQAVVQQHHQIARIRYFTARVKSRPGSQAHVSQDAYLRALQTLPNLEVHLGQFLSHPARRPRADGNGMVEVIETQEKGSDVNLASYLLLDGMRGDYEAAIVVSNDSDLATPIQLTRKELGRDFVGVVNPHQKPAVELKKVAKFQLPIQAQHLAQSQFANIVVDGTGRKIHKPSRW